MPKRNEGDEGDEMSGGIVAEFHKRISDLEASAADLHAKVDAAVKSGHMNPDLLAHVSHVMAKHFHHDRPDAAPAADDPSRQGSG